MILNSTVVEQDWLLSSILFKPTQFAKKSCGGTWPCTMLLLLSPDRSSAEEPAGLEGFQRSWSLCAASHAALSTVCNPSVLFVTQFVQMASHPACSQSQWSFPRKSSSSSLELWSIPGAALSAANSWGWDRNTKDCAVWLNRSSWLGWAGLFSSRSFGPCHSCTVQLLARPELLQGGRGCSVCWNKTQETKPSRWLWKLGLHWARGLKIHRGALWSKPAPGTVLALFICWFWLVLSWVAPGSTGAEVSAGSMSLPLQGAGGETNPLPAQPSC